MKTPSHPSPLCILCWVVGVSLLALLCTSLSVRNVNAAESVPEGVTVVSIAVEPSDFELKHRFDYRQLLVTGTTSLGESIDLTRMAKVTGGDSVVAVDASGLVRPSVDGSAKLKISFAEFSAAVNVKVSGYAEPYEVSFHQDVQPTFSRLGCNAGTCHGAKDGKAGFKLSLRGYDGLYDYRAFTDDVGARRFNRAAPSQSLMLLKATGGIPHVGGVRTPVGSPYYQLLREWIASGVQYDPEASRVKSIDISPKNPILPRAGMKQQMRVIATYTDGTTRDVSREAFVESGNIEVIDANEQGLLTMLRRGEAPVLVRYEGAYAATTLTVMGDRSGFSWKQPPANNYIDKHVYNKLQRVKVLPSELCNDQEFVRRVYLDLTGLPPTPGQVRLFVADPRSTKVKRDELIDDLIGDPEFVEHWTNKWADMLQVNRKFLGEEGAISLRHWIRGHVAANTPYDDFCREVITANGSNLENPAAAYYKILREPDAAMENTTHLFLAVRFNCNKCHDHPFERWTQDQYYEMAAFFAQVKRKEDPAFKGKTIGGSAVDGKKPLVEVIYDGTSGEVKHDRTGEVTPPQFPYEVALALDKDATRREQLAQWITSPDNQYFASSYVNRLWGYLFGVGIIEPIDDIRAGNPPTNPELLAALTQDFIDHDFDVRHMLATICKSRVYQQSVHTNRWNVDDQINYSHAIPRRLPAEVLYDTIHKATGSQIRIPGVPAGFRAAQIPDVGVKMPFLDDFGRPVRESSCECERSTGMVLGPIMKLVNGPTVAKAVGDPASELAKLVGREKDDRKVITEVFLRFFAREPTEKEMLLGLSAIENAGSEHQQNVDTLAEYEKTLPAKQQAWEKTVGRPLVWRPLDFAAMSSQVGGEFKQADQVVSVSGKSGKDVYTLTAKGLVGPVTGIRLEALPDDSLPSKGPGRAKNGNFVLSELRMFVADSKGENRIPVKLTGAKASFSQANWAVSGAVDGNAGTGWAIMPQFGKRHEATFETIEDLVVPKDGQVVFEFDQQFPDGLHLLGKFRLSVTDATRPIGGANLPANVAAILKIDANKRSEPQQKELAAYFQSLDSQLKQLRAEVANSEAALANRRLIGVQDLAWALINNPAFLFNR